MTINKNHIDNPLLYKMYEDLKNLEFIPQFKGVNNGVDAFELVDGKTYQSLSKERLISLAGALGSIRKYGYSHNNLSLDNLLFDGDSLVSIKGWENLTLDSSVNDFLYIIDNYIDLIEEHYPASYALDIILDMSDEYDRYTDDLDLGYELYWYLMSKISTCPKDSEEYYKYDNKLRFVIKYKPYLDELHQEEI